MTCSVVLCWFKDGGLLAAKDFDSKYIEDFSSATFVDDVSKAMA